MEINNLPKDIVFDIFSRIPLKSLYKLRCVCKKWQLLLDLNPEFRGFYHQKHKTNPILLYKQHNIESPTTQLSHYYIDGTQLDQFSTNFPQNLTSILTSNGILLLLSNSQALLYDPIITRASNLPNTPNFSKTFTWAFGFSPSRNLFKVVHFFTIEKFDNLHYCQIKELMCEIVTFPSSHIGLNLNSYWRFLGECPYDILGRKDYAFVNGKMYWLIGEKKFNPNCVNIMSFDLDVEVFSRVFFPRTYSSSSIECLDLVEIKGELCLSDRLPWGSTMDVWMMVKQDLGFANLWEKKYRIDLMAIMDIVHHHVRILGYLSKFDSEKNECEILIKFGEQRYGMYQVESQVFRDLSNGINNIQGWNLELMIDRKLLL